MNLLLRIAVNAAALWVAAAVVPGISLAQGGTTGSTLVTALAVGALFGLVNALVRPLALLLSLPALVLTLGLFTWVVNAAMLQLTSWLSGQLGMTFHVERFFWSAVLGALVISLVSWALSVVAPDRA